MNKEIDIAYVLNQKELSLNMYERALVEYNKGIKTTMCYCIGVALVDMNIVEYAIYLINESICMNYAPELFTYKPKEQTGAYWFTSNDRDIRVNIFNSIIHGLELEIKAIKTIKANNVTK